MLCTDRQTYDLKQGEISNAMLLLPELSLGKDLDVNVDTSVEYREVSNNDIIL